MKPEKIEAVFEADNARLVLVDPQPLGNATYRKLIMLRAGVCAG